ncbi:MAG: response regulator transcription factor [Clostridia bacterium]|nr:response regulator transcription factor [Clostridia bacterium]
MADILVVEDDLALNKLVSAELKSNGYGVTVCFNGEEALSALENKRFDLILTDVMMPVMDGFTLAENVRKTDEATPIVFMTARDDKPSKQLGYRIGIDDYVVKPFDMDLLILRVGALLRRAGIEKSKKLTVGNLVMDKTEVAGYVDGEQLALSAREFEILFKFLSNPKRTFTRSQLMNEFWDYDSSATSRTVDVYMAKIREKTSKCDGFEIVTVHGLGYKAVLK